jgi:hypothetical protein
MTCDRLDFVSERHLEWSVDGARLQAMRKSILFSTVIFCTFAASEAAMAQAATGGTRDTAAPTMVFPIRPRDEPATSRPVPNVYQQNRYQQYPPGNVRLRRIYRNQRYPQYIR